MRDGSGRDALLALAGGVTLGAAASLTSAVGSPYGPFTVTPGEGIVCGWSTFSDAALGVNAAALATRASRLASQKTEAMGDPAHSAS